MTLESPSPSRDRREFDHAVREFLGAGSLWFLTVATAVSYCRVFQGWGYLGSFVLMATIAHAGACTLRRQKIPFIFSLGILALVIYVSTSFLLLRGTLTSGLPLHATWSQGWRELVESWTQIGDAIPPVPLHSGFGIAGLVSIGLIAFLADSFAFRFAGHIEALVPSVVVFVVVGAVGIDRNRSAVTAIWVATAIVAMSVLRFRRRTSPSMAQYGYRPGLTPVRSVAFIVGMAALASLMAAAIGPRIPGAHDDAWFSHGSGTSGTRLEPLVDVRGRLTNPDDSILFTVTSDFSSYWRVTSLPNFNGERWTVSQNVLNNAGGELADATSLSNVGVATSDHVQLFDIKKLSGNFAPVAERPVQLRSSTRSLFYEPGTGTLLVSEDGLMPDDRYEILSTVVVPSADALSNSTSVSPPSKEYLELPDNQEIAELRGLVGQVIGDVTGNYEKLLALQSYFRDNFQYSLDVPPSTSSKATLEFLQRKSGYCEQFSSTFALFARILGLPSRVAVGFTPGEVQPIGTSGVDIFTVRGRYAHAWPEIWFDGIGWVLFEPTPGRGAPMANYTNVPPAQDQPNSSLAATTSSPGEPTTTSTAPSANSDTPSTTATVDSVNSQQSPGGPGIAVPLGIAAVLIALLTTWMLALPIAADYLVRRREKNRLLQLWRIIVAQFEAVHGALPAPASLHEIGDHLTRASWAPDYLIEAMVQSINRCLFQAPESIAELPSDIRLFEDFAESRLKQLPPALRISRRIRPSIAWRLAGGTKLRETSTS